MTTRRSIELAAALKRRFASWQHQSDGHRVSLTNGTPTSYHPARRHRSWQDLLTTLTQACAEHGITASRPLPLTGLGDAELTFSAIQALDPYLKHCHRHTYGTGFIPQPVVRFTGKRDERGALRPGFLTSFVNASIVQPIATVDEHVALVDAWIGVLSRLGFHARHLTISGNLTTWQRDPVSGITLRFHHQERELGDAVMLWNTADPSLMVTDIGTGLERLKWTLTREPWLETVHGTLAGQADGRLLDAVRTATLIVGSGIHPAPRGPGGAIRRVLRSADSDGAQLGLSKAIRWAHQYWSLVTPLPVPWPEVCRIIDDETCP